MPTQTTNISGFPYGIVYATSNETWTINNGVSVSATVAAVHSNFPGSTLINNGTVIGGTYGVRFNPMSTPGNLDIQNSKDGSITGQYGVYMQNFVGSASVGNDGMISGNLVGLATNGASNVEIQNNGEITSSYIAVLVSYSSGTHGAEITNNGNIEGSQIGIYVANNLGLTAEITNGSKATIKSNAYAVFSSEVLELSNKGRIDGFVLTFNLADEIINKGKINGDVYLRGGDDVFKSKGNATAGLIDMGAGNDLVVFGNKADKLLFDSALNALTNVDRVKKFQSGKDKFYLDDDIFTAIMPGTLSKSQFAKGTAAKDADDRIIYDKKSGSLYYDPDGTGVLAQTQFAQLDKNTKVKAGDFTTGEYSIILPVV